jgi:hypothetical protein
MMDMDPSYHGFGAPVPTKNYSRRASPMKMVLLIIGAVIAIGISLGLFLMSRDQTGPLQHRLSARLSTLEKIVAEGTKNAKSPALKEMNSSISIQVLSDAINIRAELKKAGVTKLDKDVVAAEADTASFKALSDASLNNRFDETYEKLIAQKLDSTNALIKELHGKTTRKSLKTALDIAYGHFKQLQTQLAASSTP